MNTTIERQVIKTANFVNNITGRESKIELIQVRHVDSLGCWTPSYEVVIYAYGCREVVNYSFYQFALNFFRGQVAFYAQC